MKKKAFLKLFGECLKDGSIYISINNTSFPHETVLEISVGQEVVFKREFSR